MKRDCFHKIEQNAQMGNMELKLDILKVILSLKSIASNEVLETVKIKTNEQVIMEAIDHLIELLSAVFVVEVGVSKPKVQVCQRSVLHLPNKLGKLVLSTYLRCPLSHTVYSFYKRSSRNGDDDIKEQAICKEHVYGLFKLWGSIWLLHCLMCTVYPCMIQFYSSILIMKSNTKRFYAIA